MSKFPNIKFSDTDISPENGSRSEKQRLLKDDATFHDKEIHVPQELLSSSTKKYVYLVLYFALNLTLTLSNKEVLQMARLPWLLTGMHATSTSIGCAALLGFRFFKTTKLNRRDQITLVLFSTLFTVNIAVSNISLAAVSIPFHQVLRSTTPVVTMLIYKFAYGRAYGRETLLAMVPLVSGVGLATYGDYSFTPLGFWLTLLGVFLGALKGVASNRLMTGSLKLSPLEILFRMSPLAALQCFIMAYAVGEVDMLQSGQLKATGLLTSPFLLISSMNIAIAFLLNFVSFEANKVAGALTISVCANVKQALTILLGIVLFSVHVATSHGVGIVITLLGASWYSSVDWQNSRKAKLAADVRTGQV